MRANIASRRCTLDSVETVVKPTSMLRRLCIIPLLMQACVLESETCGEPFTAAEGRCVVIQSQPNAQDGGVSDGLVFAMDAEAVKFFAAAKADALRLVNSSFGNH